VTCVQHRTQAPRQPAGASSIQGVVTRLRDNRDMSKADEYDDYDRWVVRAKDRWGNSGYYGEGRRRIPAVVPYRGNAYRFVSELHARESGYRARDAGYLTEFEVEELPPRPVFKKTASGREGNT